ncbi:MAG: hypothetical protein IPM69_19605 [Ignavibacteria bacterium]|nr:hypothetical protein [Ignavibacteria bacterium]
MNPARITLPILSFVLLFAVVTVTFSKDIIKRPKRPTINSTDGRFRISLPLGFKVPQPDSQLINTDFGVSMFHAYIADTKKSGCMVGYYDYTPESLAGKDIAAVIDTTQMRIISNMGGKLTRKYKLVREGRQTRTSYFTTVSKGDTTSYWRFELVFDNPRVYQIGFTSTNSKLLEATETKNFFTSFKIVK